MSLPLQQREKARREAAVRRQAGVGIDKVDIIQGDSEKVPTGWGTAGSRSMVIGGSALSAIPPVAPIAEPREMSSRSVPAGFTDVGFRLAFGLGGRSREVSRGWPVGVAIHRAGPAAPSARSGP